MALENILNELPDFVVEAATIALGNAPTSASKVSGAIMLGTNGSYESDNWVKISYNNNEIQKVVKVHPFSDENDEDVTQDILSKMKADNENKEASIKRRRLVKHSK